ncbi:MAG: methylmalonyl-CoA mutase family protein [Nocardioides sp.]
MTTWREATDQWQESVSGTKARDRRGELGDPLALSYFAGDEAPQEQVDRIGVPGAYPFTRGVYPAMYRERLWQMRLYSGFGTAEDTNQRWRFLLEHGNNGVSCAFDLPTQCGFDSDHPEAGAEIGRVGVAVDSVRDFLVLFDGLPLDRLAVSLNAHSTAPMLLAMFLAAAERTGVDAGQVNGSMTTDVLKDYVARGTWIYPPAAGLRLVGDVLEFCSEEMPRFYPLVIRGPDMRDAGATMAQEVGFAFANAVCYLDYARERGLDIDAFAPRLSGQFYFYGHFLQEAAKARAARRIWARMMKERYGVQKRSSSLLRITASVGGTHYQAAEPETNIVRGTLGCLGAILGGTQGMLLAGYDEAYDIPTEHTARIALRTQQIVGYESDATAVADPLGGSWFVEAMTDQIESAVLAEMDKVAAAGGAVAAIESGYMQRMIASSAYEQERAESDGSKPLVGVNLFAEEDSTQELVVHAPDPDVRTRQLARLEQLRLERDDAEVRSRLERLRNAAEGDANLMPFLIDCARAEVTLGEMVETLRTVFGEFREPAL